jgi:hypothetical protein
MKLLIDDLFCSMFMVENPETKQPEIIIRFTNFETEAQAMEFVHTFKSQPEYEELSEKVTLH